MLVLRKEQEKEMKSRSRQRAYQAAEPLCARQSAGRHVQRRGLRWASPPPQKRPQAAGEESSICAPATGARPTTGAGLRHRQAVFREAASQPIPQPGQGEKDRDVVDSRSFIMAKSASVATLRPSTAAIARGKPAVSAKVIELMIMSNWGDTSQVGLGGVIAMGDKLQEIPLSEPEVYFGVAYSSSDGRDSSIVRRAGTPKVLHGTTALNLVQGGNHASDDVSRMWIVKRANAIRDGFVVDLH